MIKIALGQMEVIPGHPDLNTKTMHTMIDNAKKQHADLIIFPEMAIPGYLLGDTWEQRAFLKDCECYGKEIIAASVDICIMFGNVAMDWSKKNNDGRVRKYNAFFTAYQGILIGNPASPYPFTIKTLLPNYREFDDSRHFFSLEKLMSEYAVDMEQLLKPIEISFPQEMLKVGCLLCEDGWSDNYQFSPLSVLNKKRDIDLLVNISSSPYTLGKNDKRHRVFSKQAKENLTPLIYVNSIGIQNNGKTIYTFDGSSTLYDANGSIVACCPPYEEKLQCVPLDCKKSLLPSLSISEEDTIAALYRALSYGIKKFLHSIRMDKVVIGISGGIDSSVAAALYVDALGSENVLLVNMPSVFNSNTTKGLSLDLARNLGCKYSILPIQESVDYTIKQLETTPILDPEGQIALHLNVSSFVAENIQARDRSARILAGVAASWGAGFTCNANKSETTVGYSTLYGDQSGFLAVLADLWKHQVYALANHLNREVYKREVIPQATIDIVPSAELSNNQCVDEGKGDPIQYPYHDYLFRAFMEEWNKAAPEDILQWYADNVLEEEIGCEKGLVASYFPDAKSFIADLERWWNLFSGMAVAKRIQSPPILAVSRRAYGFDHREAQNRPYYTKRYAQLKKTLLK